MRNYESSTEFLMLKEFCSREIGPKKKRVQLNFMDYILYVATCVVQDKIDPEDSLLKESLEEIGILLPREKSEILFKLLQLMKSIPSGLNSFETKLGGLYKDFALKFRSPQAFLDQNLQNLKSSAERSRGNLKNFQNFPT